ncbi:MAG: hypothetical protein V7631_4246 [Massilia sp.]|jgi:signal transduction histidine kinase
MSPVDRPYFADEDLEAAVLRLTQDQMLVNQTLVEKILAYEQVQAALRVSEKKLHDLLAHQLASREAERKRISKQIHDSLGQNLLALRMDMVMLHQHLDGKDERLNHWVGAALGNVDETLRAVKGLIADLHPSFLELGLVDSIDVELRKFARSHSIAADFAAQDGLAALPVDENLVLVLYRALQECLDNVQRHARASRVHVALMLDGDMLCLVVADNGVGFDPAAPRKASGFGLAGLQEHLASHGGALDIDTALSAGTSITVSLPLVLTSPHPSAEP